MKLSPLALSVVLAIPAYAFVPQRPSFTTAKTSVSAQTTKVDVVGTAAATAALTIATLASPQIAMATTPPPMSVVTETIASAATADSPQSAISGSNLLMAGNSFETLDFSLPSYSESVGKTPEAKSSDSSPSSFGELKFPSLGSSEESKPAAAAVEDTSAADAAAEKEAKKQAAADAKAEAEAEKQAEKEAKAAAKAEKEEAARKAEEDKARKAEERAARVAAEKEKQRLAVERANEQKASEELALPSLGSSAPAPAPASAPMKMPDISIPDVKVPDIKVPDFKGFSMPKIDIPDMPKVEIPDLPKVEAPKTDFALPVLPTPAPAPKPVAAPKATSSSYDFDITPAPAPKPAPAPAPVVQEDPDEPQEVRDERAKVANTNYKEADTDAKDLEQKAQAARKRANDFKTVYKVAKDDACRTRFGGKVLCIRPLDSGF